MYKKDANIKKIAGAIDASDTYDQKMIEIRRVTRVTAGGKHMSFRACVVIGDRKGNVGMGIAKGPDVSISMNKAVQQARKNIIHAQIVGTTIPHEVRAKFKTARIMLKPARQGTGLVAGGVARAILDLAGYQDVVSKMLGASNKINNARVVMQVLQSFKNFQK